MGQLKILAGGSSPQAASQARGKLFEDLMAKVLRHYGYGIDNIPSVNYAGMEIDIEGKHIVTSIPLYAECKCYENEVDSPKLQAFFGKYMNRWLKDKRCQGLFIALPGINSHARGFYNDIIANSEITFSLFEKEHVLNTLFDTGLVASSDTISKFIDQSKGIPGDWLLLYTDKGLFWIQYVIPLGSAIPSEIAIFDSQGNPLLDKSTIDYLTQLYPEIDDFEIIFFEGGKTSQKLAEQGDMEEIVEVRGSSACFEYQFPASPEHFVGRQQILKELNSFTTEVMNKEISSRGILFEANSGWGKSSVVLASVALLREKGHFAIAIDSRSASTSQFILRVVEYVLNRLSDIHSLIPEDHVPKTITGFDGAVKALIDLGRLFEKISKTMFIFLDQFENVFYLPEVLKRIRDLFLKVCDAQTNIVLGFSWKTDLIGLTTDFPYQIRDTIAGSSKRITLNTFSEVETTALLGKLSSELRADLRKDLVFFLSDFSQGYPWLLKKLCAHVKAQREAGVLQSQIANSLLNVEELFQEDLRGLSSEQEDTLRRIAKAAPISVSELGEEFKYGVVQSLVNSRLLVRIGNKYDVYWDIFRDYLNAGRVPIQENYILRMQVGSVVNSTKLLSKYDGKLSIADFQEKVGLSEKTFYNIARDMRVLGIAKVDAGTVTLQIIFPKGEKEFDVALRGYLRERLRLNRLVWRLIKALEIETSLNLDEIENMLAQWCPYISATPKTWRLYARIFADWMDASDLAIFDRGTGKLTLYTPGKEVRERDLPLAKRRGGITIPCIQYKPIEKAAIMIVQSATFKGIRPSDWSSFSKSTLAKALATLEDLGFLSRKTISGKSSYLKILPKAIEFVQLPKKRQSLFAEGALKMKSFATFIDLLESHKNSGCTLYQLAAELRHKLGVDWTDGTAGINVKIMLNWARHTGLAPKAFVYPWKGLRKGPGKNKRQAPLF